MLTITTLELELKLPNADDIAELTEEGCYTGVLAWYSDEETGQAAQAHRGRPDQS